MGKLIVSIPKYIWGLRYIKYLVLTLACSNKPPYVYDGDASHTSLWRSLYVGSLLPPPLPLAYMLPLWGSVVSISEHELWAPQPCLQSLLLHSLYEHKQVTWYSGCSCLVCRMGNDSSASHIGTVVGTEMMAIKPLTQHLAHRTYPHQCYYSLDITGQEGWSRNVVLGTHSPGLHVGRGIFIQTHSAQHWDELMLQIPSVQHSFTPFLSFSFAAILPQPNPGSFGPGNQRELGSNPRLLTVWPWPSCLTSLSLDSSSAIKDSMRQRMQHA